MKISYQYIAGLIDGEGYISLLPVYKTHNKYGHSYSPVIKVAMCGEPSERLLNTLKTKYGGYIDRRKPQREHFSKSVCWTLRNKPQVTQFLENVYPYLLVKKQNAQLVLEYCHLPKVYSGQAEQYQATRLKNTEIYNELRKLTRRGHVQRLSDQAQ